MNIIRKLFGKSKRYYYVSFLKTDKNSTGYGKIIIIQDYGKFDIRLFEKYMKEKYNYKSCVPIYVQEMSKKEKEEYLKENN